MRGIIARAAVVHFGIPCTSFSLARRGQLGRPGGPLRSTRQPMGLPNLPPADQDKVKMGNLLLNISLGLIKFCRRIGLTVTAENPHYSRICHAPGMVRQLRWGKRIRVDFCRFAVWNTDVLDAMAATCGGEGKICGTTGKPHVILSGSAPGGMNMTSLAEPYPRLLCSRYATLI